MTLGATILDHYLARTPRSALLAQRARDCIPGGIVTDTRRFEPYGIYVDRAAGVRKWDVDGNSYLDFFGGHGANLLGHSHPKIVAAVKEAMDNGVQFAANQPLEVALAEQVLRMVASVERLRFTSSGTEATLLALRLARTWTGRSKVVRFATHYHGWHDHAASGYNSHFDGAPAAGVLAAIAENTLLLPAGDAEALQAAFERHRTDIAAVIVEPVGTHFGVVPLAAPFLSMIQELAADAGALFILDEVLSGFRVAPGGAQETYGLAPDLTTFGKILCGGLPGGAVGGRADVINLLDYDADRRSGRPKVLHQGTFTANPLSMAAGLVMLEAVETTDACAHVNDLGAEARIALNAMFEAERLPCLAYGAFSIFHILLSASEDQPVGRPSDLNALPAEVFTARPQPVLNRLRMALNIVGLDVNTKISGLMSAVHERGDIDILVEGMARAFHLVREEGLIAGHSVAV